MCCSYEIGQESYIKFSNFFYYPEIEKYLTKENFSFKTKDFEGKEITDYYSGYPVCKFFGKVLRIDQNYLTGGAPTITGVESNFDFLLSADTEERFNLKNIKKESPVIGEAITIFDDGKLPQVGQDVYGVLTKGYKYNSTEILKFYKNEEEYIKKETEILFCEREDKVLEEKITQISEKNFEKNKSFEINFHFFYIFIIFVLILIIGFLVYKKKKGKNL